MGRGLLQSFVDFFVRLSVRPPEIVGVINQHVGPAHAPCRVYSRVSGGKPGLSIEAEAYTVGSIVE